jgi:hypothetical protein
MEICWEGRPFFELMSTLSLMLRIFKYFPLINRIIIHSFHQQITGIGTWVTFFFSIALNIVGGKGEESLRELFTLGENGIFNFFSNRKSFSVKTLEAKRAEFMRFYQES